MFACRRVSTCTHVHTQIHSSIHTSLVFVHTHQHNPTSHTPDVCAYRSVPIHACTPLLPLSHTHPQAHCLPSAPPHTLAATCAASGCASSSTTTTWSPVPLIAAQCRGSFPSACARADSRQCQHTTHAADSKAAKRPCTPACYPL